MPSCSMDTARAREFATRMSGAYVEAMVTLMVDLGYRTGLFDALATGPATSAELAERTDLSERHVREWLGSIAGAGITEYDADTGRHTLPPEHAMFLCGDSPTNLAASAGMITSLAPHVGEVARTFREGGGLPYAVYRPEFTTVMDQSGRRKYTNLLVSHYLPLADGLPDRLTRGARALDLGCGTGHTTNLLAGAFPASTFLGVDIADDAITLARAEAERLELDNVDYALHDIRTIADTDDRFAEPFDVVFGFDVIHDQVDPVGVLAGIRGSLADDGWFFCYDIAAHSALEDNLDNPRAALIYGISTLHCMQVSLAHDGAGLGTAWGEELATEMFRDAGFSRVAIRPLELDPMNQVYVCRP